MYPPRITLNPTIRKATLMDRSYTMPRLCFTTTAVLALLGVALRTVCLLCFYDADPGYFVEGFLPSLSNVLYFIAVAVGIIGALLVPKNTLPSELHIPQRAPLAVLLGIALAVFTIISLFFCFPARRSDIMLAPTLLGLLASTYYFLSASRNGRYPDWLSFLGYLPVFWSIGSVAETYFDPYTTMNSPVKLALQMGFLGFMLVALAELRFRVGRSLPRYSLALLALGSYTCLVGSIPILIATGARVLESLQHLLYAVVLLCAGLYSLYLLFSYTCRPATVTDEAPQEDQPPSPASANPNAE